MRQRLYGAGVVFGLVGMLVAGATTGAAGSPGDATQAMTIEGVWVARVTLRNCNTGDPVGPPFNSLLTFGRDGTLIESTGATAFAAGQRTNAHGSWRRLGAQQYSQNVLAIIRFTTAPNFPFSPGFTAGTQTIDQVIDQTAPDAFTSSGTTTFYDEAGAPYRQGCATAVGRRYQ